MNELAVFEEAKEDWYGWGLGREGDDFGGGVREVGRKGLWTMIESAYYSKCHGKPARGFKQGSDMI